MNATSIAISIFANFILQAGVFEKIKAVVSEQQGKLLSGAEKRNVVLKELEVIGITAGTSLINLGIELAVAWLKASSK